MIEFITELEARDIGIFAAPLMLIFFAGLAFVIRTLDRRREAKKVDMPHTMSNDEYTRLNAERMNNINGETGAVYNSYSTGPK
jgi:hypothetical protein